MAAPSTTAFMFPTSTVSSMTLTAWLGVTHGGMTWEFRRPRVAQIALKWKEKENYQLINLPTDYFD
jgi:hypothetical protein